MVLHNLINKEELKEKLQKEKVKRTTVSFYRYIKIKNPKELRDSLYNDWSKLNILGRIYLAKEGINAQLNVPKINWENFVENLYSNKEFNNVPFKIAVEDNGKSFYKLTIKVKDKIVADGINDPKFDSSQIGKHLDAVTFNKTMEEKDVIVVDMRNHYESEIGHFENAILPDSDTFREELPLVKNILKDKKDKKILLYCTGGIRCEKASAYLKYQGFKKVYQLKGGIIEYAREIKEKGLESKFKGKNFVFDERIGEKITDDIISNCHQCSVPCDTHTNCKNNACHLLFIQCKKCEKKFGGCCTIKCQEIAALPIEEQRKLRKNSKELDSLKVYKSRLRPKLNAY